MALRRLAFHKSTGGSSIGAHILREPKPPMTPQDRAFRIDSLPRSTRLRIVGSRNSAISRRTSVAVAVSIMTAVRTSCCPDVENEEERNDRKSVEIA